MLSFHRLARLIFLLSQTARYRLLPPAKLAKNSVCTLAPFSGEALRQKLITRADELYSHFPRAKATPVSRHGPPRAHAPGDDYCDAHAARAATRGWGLHRLQR